MAELRLTGPAEDGGALRLTDEDGHEHSLPLTAYLRRLVLEGTEQEHGADDDEADRSSEGEGPMAGAVGSAGSPVGGAHGGQSPAASPADVGQESVETDPAASAPRPKPLAPRIPAPVSPDPELEATTAVGSPQPTRPPAELRPAPPRPSAPSAPLADQDSVRAAATQEAPPLSPREIQQRIRAGASVEQVARESGNPFSRIRGYGFPVLAERGYVAQQARAVEIWVGGPDLYSSTVEDGGPSTLGELADHRLRELGAPADALEWDAWREPSGTWTVVARFSAEGLRAAPTAEEPPARWSFRPAGRRLDPQNAWARVLSDAEAWDVFADADPQDAPQPAAPSPQPVASSPEADAPVDDLPDEAAVTPLGARTALPDPDADLLDILRARRGRRVGSDADSDDALAHLIAREAATRATPTPLHHMAPEGVATADPAETPHAERPTGVPSAAEADEESPSDGAAPSTAEAAAPSPAEAVDVAEATEPTTTPATPAARPRARSAARRASVPSWDEIVFGRKGE